MNRQLRKLIKLIQRSNGRFFYAEVIKKNGKLRKMIARIGVDKNRSGDGLAYDPARYGLVVVWDATVRAYRMLNLKALQYFKCGNLVWRAAK